MKIVVAGDFCDKYRVKEQISAGNYGLVSDEIRSKIADADFRILNFEFPIVSGTAGPIRKCGPNLEGQTASVEVVKSAGFNVCTLANNHILDQGGKCCLDTRRILEEAGIRTVGAGSDLEEASSVLYLESGGETLAVINCCEHEFSVASDRSAGANPLSAVRQYAKIKEARAEADYVLVIVHGGHEHFQLPSPRMKELYRFFVDAGADAVVNHHQHCFSGYEVYEGKPIFYGLGNFLFDHLDKRDDIWNQGYFVELTFASEKDVDFTVTPYMQCQEQPAVRLMNSAEAGVFDGRISELNSIIADDVRLAAEVEKFWDSRSGLLNLFFDFNSKVLRRLRMMGILKMPSSEEKMLRIWNLMECESHRDIILHGLHRKFGRKQ